MLHVHRSDRADALVDMLADLVAKPLDDPMTAEVVSVPTQGIERWLTQRLSMRLGVSGAGRHDGVCANVDFPFPGTLVSGALARASGVADTKTDPWLPERAVWPLMEVVEEHFDDPWLAPLAQHIRNSGQLADDAGGAEPKRFAVIRHVADLFDRYAVHRPDMVRRWVSGERDSDEPEWQVKLWQLLRQRIDRESPAERLLTACDLIRDDYDLLDLPQRLSLFGLTRLAASYLDVLEAVQVQRDVHLFLLHPSPALWKRLEPMVGPESRHTLRRDDPTAALPRHPLLASWGRDARETQLVLGAAERAADAPSHSAGDEAPHTLLGRIQADVRADRDPRQAGEADTRPLLAADDTSIRIHSCHGRGRQVEVLRDAILHLLEDDEELEPRDIIVMCPDIEAFAPLIEATFAAPDSGEQAQELQIRLADRAIRQTNPVMAVLDEVLGLASARLTATEVLDLAGRDPVRRRFHFSDDDLDRLAEWVDKAYVRWGFDAEHRRVFQIKDIGANTWESGLDRILLGVAMAEEDQHLFAQTLPLDDVDGSDIDLAGRLTEFVDRLRTAVDALNETRPIDEWVATLATVSDSLTATTARDSWQRAQLMTVLDELAGEAAQGDVTSAVDLACDDIRSILSERLRGRPTRANFRTGHLTVCTLVPMRSIPHRVVCLLGLDDRTFPRHIERDGDDLTAKNQRVGDRDVRSEDRQLLLDAVLAAGDHLIVTYSGHDERTNLHKPPAVPVGELLDVVDRTVRVENGRARDAIVVQHPLQPFDVWNFQSNGVVDGPWSFNRLQLDGARSAQAPRHELPAFLPDPLPDERAGRAMAEPLALEQLERFVRHPVRAFLRQRLHVSYWDDERDSDDAIPIDMGGLAGWSVGQRMLQARLAGATQAACESAEIARGALPPGHLARDALADMDAILGDLLAAGLSPDDPETLEVDVLLSNRWNLRGSVSVRGDIVHEVTYSKLPVALRMAAWLRLLALTATCPERPFSARTVGRRRGWGDGVSVATIAPLAPDAASRKAEAERHLGVLVDLFERGMREPLPLYCKTSEAWVAAATSGGDPVQSATKAWESEPRRGNEDKDTEHLLVLREVLTFDAMVAHSGPPRPGEAGAGWSTSAASRFELYADRLWEGLLSHEEVVDR